MDLIVRLQVYIFSVLVLLIIYVQLKKESQSYLLNDWLFRHLVLSTIAILVLEAIAWSVDGKLGTMAYIINLGSNMLLHMITTIPLTIWILYIIETVNRDKKVVIKYLKVLGIPIMINMLIALSAPVNEKYFYVDANNLYHRGEWAVIAIAIYGMLLIVSVFVTLYNWRKINHRNRVLMLLFMVPPTIGLMLQTMFYGVSLIWAGATISILMGYVMIQSQVVKTDYLTGLYNRRELDTYIERKISNLSKSKTFAGVMIDLDDFKTINDNYGHIVGDQAIKTAAFLIIKSFRREDFIARYGGDEFIVIFDIKDKKDLSHKVDLLKKQFELFNEKKDVIFELNISVGCGIYTWEDSNREGFIHRIDQLMYENKSKKKERKRGELAWRN